jgi:hypothetical protein
VEVATLPEECPGCHNHDKGTGWGRLMRRLLAGRDTAAGPSLPAQPALQLPAERQDAAEAPD